MQKTDKTEEVVDLLELAEALWHRAWAIVLTMILGGALAFSYAFFLVTPVYEATAMLYVNNNDISLGSTKVSISSGDLQASQGLIDTYSVILKSRSTLEAVIKKAGVPYTYGQLKEMVSAGSVDGTEVMQITTTDADPEEAKLITNTIVDILPERIVTVVEGSSVQIVDYAVTPARPVSPNVTKTTLLGMLIGLVLSAGVIVVLHLADNTLHTEDFLLEAYSDIPLLAAIPDLSSDSHGYGYGEKRSKSKYGEGA